MLACARIRHRKGPPGHPLEQGAGRVERDPCPRGPGDGRPLEGLLPQRGAALPGRPACRSGFHGDRDLVRRQVQEVAAHRGGLRGDGLIPGAGRGRPLAAIHGSADPRLGGRGRGRPGDPGRHHRKEAGRGQPEGQRAQAPERDPWLADPHVRHRAGPQGHLLEPGTGGTERDPCPRGPGDGRPLEGLLPQRGAALSCRPACRSGFRRHRELVCRQVPEVAAHRGGLRGDGLLPGAGRGGPLAAIHGCRHPRRRGQARGGPGDAGEHHRTESVPKRSFTKPKSWNP